MNTDIRYIFLDLGGTFRVIDKDPAYLAAARAKIAELCDAGQMEQADVEKLLPAATLIEKA